MFEEYGKVGRETAVLLKLFKSRFALLLLFLLLSLLVEGTGEVVEKEEANFVLVVVVEEGEIEVLE